MIGFRFISRQVLRANVQASALLLVCIMASDLARLSFQTENLTNCNSEIRALFISCLGVDAKILMKFQPEPMRRKQLPQTCNKQSWCAFAHSRL